MHGIEKGAGNFTMTSYWSSALPGTGDELFMELYSISPISEAAGLTVSNSFVAGRDGRGTARSEATPSASQ